MGQYEQMLEDLREAFKSGRTRSKEWRLSQLHGILKLMDENKDKLHAALKKDLHKHHMEAQVMETQLCVGEVIDTINELSNWMKPQKVSKSPLYMMDSAYIQPEPFGVTLIMGAWNYPVQLVILPLIGAVSAGNCAIVKPSELSEATALLLEELVPKYLDNDCVKVVNGGIPETTDLLSEKFDLIFYTGNSMVARIVMNAAAKHLTPVVLELGGKSPVYVDKGTDLNVVARRLCWGKFANAGQTCIAPDYVMCPRDLQDGLVNAVKKTIGEFFGEDPRKSDSYARIVNTRHYQRIQKLKKGSFAAVEGEDIKSEKYIAPTVLRDVKLTDPVMQEEVFGPLLPIMPVENHKEALDIINNGEKPLALYVFTNNSNMVKDFRDKTSSGAVLINDTVVHGGLTTLPFGGVGNSGIGAYHGKFSFDTFSHMKPVLEKSLALESVQSIRYPPYSDTKLGWVSWIMKKKVKKTGMLSLIPFMVVSTFMAMLFKFQGLGVGATELSGGDSNQ